MNPDLRQANEFYKKSQESFGISKVLKRSYLEKAMSLYTKEMSKATRETAPSIQRNLGFASYRLADLLDPKFDLSLVIYYFAEAVKAFSIAWNMKPDQQNTDWGGKLEELISDCFEKSYRSCEYYIRSIVLLDLYKAQSATLNIF